VPFQHSGVERRLAVTRGPEGSEGLVVRRLVGPLIIGLCLGALLASCFGAVVLHNRQFAYRDAGHYYYPLYERVQKEWEAGRWPLWEPEECAGMPLLGNPTAAVMYPGKVIYALLPYAWAARIYVILHTLLAFATMLVLMRSWETSWIGSGLSALAYAFGAPILFLYSNIIFLVGAAWTPLAFRAIDRWLRLGKRGGLLELAAVLALQTLGGDPESAYITGICAGGYALGLAWLEGKRARVPARPGRVSLVLGLAAFLWIIAALVLARFLPDFRVSQIKPLARWAVPGIWVVAGVLLIARWLRRPGSRLAPMLSGLAASAALGAAIASVQVIPALEFVGQSERVGESGLHDVYGFSLEPARVIELIWPNVYGTLFAGNTFWLPMVTTVKVLGKAWVPSLYLGGLTIVLALSSFGCRAGPPWRCWLSAIVIVSLVASMGEHTSPVRWARTQPALAAQIGPRDPDDETGLRLDGKLKDGDGGVYWSLASLFPGFRQFRYPSKLLSFTALALAGLAGMGWDRLMAGGARRANAIAAALLLLSLAALIFVTSQHDRIVSALKQTPAGQALSLFGPHDAAGAVAAMQLALAQGAAVYVCALVLGMNRSRMPGLAGAFALLLLTADLAVANARLVLSVPQEVMDQTPRVVERIERAGRAAKSPMRGPFRVHRLPIWEPLAWYRQASMNRISQIVAWQRDTILPKFGLRYGTQYTYTQGIAGIPQYMRFFEAVTRPSGADMGPQPGALSGQAVVEYPRGAFDLWNTRYFVMTAYPESWRRQNPGIEAFLHDTEVIYPPALASAGVSAGAAATEWQGGTDFQILRNLNHFERAWIVHDSVSESISLDDLLAGADTRQTDRKRRPIDFRKTVSLQPEQAKLLGAYLPGPGASEPLTESVAIASYGPQRVELEATLERPGLVILSDIFYPGWRLEIDGAEAPIHKVNRIMRGAAVSAGRHRLNYRYQPRSFQVGGWISLSGIATLIVLAIACIRRPD
jgi:hypothetical protein